MSNGGNKTWAIWLAGCLFTLICVIGFPTLIGYVVANDNASRDRDVEVERRLGDSLKDGFKDISIGIKEISTAQHSMEVSITGIQKDVEYLKKKRR